MVVQARTHLGNVLFRGLEFREGSRVQAMEVE